MAQTAEILQQEADVLLSLAHFIQAARLLLPEGNDTRERLGELAESCAEAAGSSYRFPGRKSVRGVERPPAPAC